ncbi:uncharacterized protein LOC126631309 [Malus sylvestris]|uniref:uncharacterized protein LOC126631309 n=1 Tax=Malus sylvestris TaxID=3752 RepID=UPI0021AC50B8|nr:uncharacterized protein LOC126631309 [Malus sylvestris]
MPHAPQPRHGQVEHREEQPRPIDHDWRQSKVPLPQRRQIQEEVKRVITEPLHNFQHNEAADDAIQRDMTNISMSPFTNEIERTNPPRGFTMPHFIPYKGYEDPDRHLKHYRSTMILYRNNDVLMCKNFTITLQGKAQDCIVKDSWETIRNYVKRFKAEKAKIVGCNEDIATAAFINGLPTEHPLFGKLIMREELTLAASYALAEKHALWDEAKQSNKNESEKKHMERSLTREDSVPETFTKFIVPIGQILRKLKNEPWFELPPPMKVDLTRLDYINYCAFHQGPDHTTNGCLKWKQYLEKLTYEGRCDEYLNRLTEQPTQAGEVFITP